MWSRRSRPPEFLCTVLTAKHTSSHTERQAAAGLASKRRSAFWWDRVFGQQHRSAVIDIMSRAHACSHGWKCIHGWLLPCLCPQHQHSFTDVTCVAAGGAAVLSVAPLHQNGDKQSLPALTVGIPRSSWTSSTVCWSVNTACDCFSAAVSLQAGGGCLIFDQLAV